MIENKRVAVVLPAYNAAKTLRATYDEIPKDIVDDCILTDDASSDDTVGVAAELGIHTIRHEHNRGYGGNQKTCYRAALDRGADIVVMLHPDYQYTPRLVTAMVAMLASGHFDAWVEAKRLGTAVNYSGNCDGCTRNSRIDYVFWSRSASFLALKSAQMIDTRDSSGDMPSDHKPMLVSFDVK